MNKTLFLSPRLLALAIAGGCFVTFSAARAQITYSVTDLGTLGGSTSTASVGGDVKGSNKARMIVGSSNVSDGSEHAFLFTGGKMYDLNLLCDLSTSDFKVLTVAKTIDDCGEIIGEGIASNGDKHAFLLTPNPVDGGRWCYDCCQWVWKQDKGGWWWENNSHSYQWHGGPGPHGQCPPNPPHCWWWPLPCPEGCGCDHQCLPPDWCYCCINGVIYVRPTADCQARGGQCYSCPEDAVKNCQPCNWCCVNGKVFPSNAEQCRKKGGQCFGTEEDAIRNCKACWWCCLDGNVSQTTWADCQKKGGQCFASQEEAQAANCAKTTPTPTPPPTPIGPPSKLCWVCIDGHPTQIPQADAAAKHLRCYPTANAAKKSKDCVSVGGWCCVVKAQGEGDQSANQVFAATAAQCADKGGHFFNSQIDAIQLCMGPPPQTPTPPPCWCCIQGPAGKQVIASNVVDCQRRGGQCYVTEREANAHCTGGETPPPTCWVCIDGKAVQMRQAEAFAKKLTCYPTAEAAQNSKECAPPSCWCCIPGPVRRPPFKTTSQDCAQKGGQCYGSEEEANARCGGGATPSPTCWVCIDGQIMQISEADAQNRHLTCYRSREDAAKACGEGPKIWCCIDGQVMQSTEAECRARNGQAYRSEKEARARCGGGGKCWSCVNGKVVELSQAQARGRGLPCFGSREEASANCRPKETETKCWVCVNGRVIQVPEAQARARGVRCFGSREEAMQNCQQRQRPSRRR